MSTRSTVLSADNYHLYEEVFETDVIYLEAEGANCEARVERIEPHGQPPRPYVSVTIRLGEAEWEAIAAAIARRRHVRRTAKEKQ